MKKNYIDIIDPIHDFIRVYDYELPIIDNPLFQRLRRIKQLSGAHLTYPSAQHSRFEHSLGVMHIASQAGFALNEKGFLNSDDVHILRIAGLLHDIGHGPFSHLFEEVIQEKIADDPAYAAQVLTFLEDQLTQKFFPFALHTRVWPGFVFRWTTKAHYEGLRWGLEMGTDTWVQAKEHLSHIKKPKNIPQDLNVKISRKPIAYQWKVFGSIFYKYDGNNSNWVFGLSGDYSFAYTGIGSDYTMAFVIEKHF